MGKKKSSTPNEAYLLVPTHSALLENSAAPSTLVDTHTHLLSTFSFYRQRYKEGKYEDVYSFARAMWARHKVESIVDVWCEAPVQKAWRELADSAIDEADRREKWGGTEYWFVIGVHPHEAKNYNSEVESDIVTALTHPRNVGLGEIGLDYHYSLSPHDVQQTVFAQQLRLAVKLGKPLTIHTREAEADTERILKEEVPKEWKIHIHCFTDSPEFAERLLGYFPNLYIGITGVVTYTTNLNTVDVVRRMVASQASETSRVDSEEKKLRILLETDAPYMVPGNIYADASATRDACDPFPKGGRFPLCHTGMMPWSAQFIVDNLQMANSSSSEPSANVATWTTERVLRVARQNARVVYGV